MQGWFKILKIYQINRLKKKIIMRSIDTEKAFDKNPTPS
jgi:hypothetical protein